MTDETLDTLLADAFNQEVKVPAKMVYKVREEARKKAQEKELRKESYPYLLILLIYMALVLTCATGLTLLTQSLKTVVCMIIIMFSLINLPIAAYVLAMLYYKDQEAYENLKEDL